MRLFYSYVFTFVTRRADRAVGGGKDVNGRSYSVVWWADRRKQLPTLVWCGLCVLVQFVICSGGTHVGTRCIYRADKMGVLMDAGPRGRGRVSRTR
jgi:hypothetical protein